MEIEILLEGFSGEYIDVGESARHNESLLGNVQNHALSPLAPASDILLLFGGQQEITSQSDH